MQALPTLVQPISFGDCDPAGIVFYPNIFRWMDAAFHNGLKPLGGHAAVCRRLGAIGLGLIDASAGFRAPLRDGDRVELRPTLAEWGRKTLTVSYEGFSGGRLAFTGREVRGVFLPTPDGITAGDVAPLREMLQAIDGS